MPTYKVTDPKTGKIINITGDSPPTEQELIEIFDRLTPPMPFLPKEKEVEQLISEKSDSVATLMKEYRTPYDFKKHPIKSALKPAVTVAKTFAIPFQRGESAVAGLGLGLQKKDPLTLEGWKTGLKYAGQGLIGKRQQELGDIIRTTGFGGKLNEPLARGIGFFGLVGLTNLATQGKLISGTKKVETVIKGKLPKIMDKDYALNRAKQLNEGLEDLRNGFGSLKSEAIKQFGKDTVNAQKLSKNLPSLPKNIFTAIDDPVYAIEKLPDGSIKPTIENLDKIKGMLADKMSGKDWLDATKQVKTNIKQAYGAISEAIAEIRPEIRGSLDAYHYFMKDIYNPIKKILTTGGQIVEKKLRGALAFGGERSKQKAIEEFTKLWNEAPQLVKDVIKFNQRQFLKSRIIPAGVGTGAALYGLERLGRRILPRE